MVHIISGVKVVVFCVTVLSFSGSGAYDSSSSCSPAAGRAGRARTLRGIPCDLTRNSYCHLPGSAYPWHAVRRFVHENQGLMRRMYGDQRHIAVLQAEIDDNSFGFEITDEDRWSTSARYSRQEFVRKPTDRKLLHLKLANEVYTVPHFRPTTHPPVRHNEEEPEIQSTNDEDNSIAKNPQVVHNIQPIQIGINDVLKTVKESNSAYNNVSSNNELPITTNSEKIEENVTTSSPLAFENETTTEYDMNETTTENIAVEGHMEDDSSEEDDSVEEDSAESEEDTEETTEYSINNESEKKEDVNIKKDTTISEKIANIYKNSVTPQTEEASASGTKLFQDAAAQESAPQVMKLRGINACPVKEEVVAPFWANNTRGEVLALLNLYPFEQYVHWEKCSHEHKQMFCREGCRCEQQYRLHRLLAYDPHNECRGIFSDWFRFPSCCVCKCYDMPVEFRVTSRSPRASEPKDHMSSHWNEEVEDIVKRELYRHATDRWYNPIDG